MGASEARQGYPADTQARAAFPWPALAMAAVVLAIVAIGTLLLRPQGGAYPRLERDHDELMVSRTAKPASTITVLFIGNSLTFRNDLPAMLVNLASSDSGNSTRLQVKGETYPDASLDDMFAKTYPLDWARQHHPNYVVLQEHSFWYDTDFEAARAAASRWANALRSLDAAPLLFQVWADGEGSDVYTHATYHLTPADDARSAADSTDSLGRSLGLPVVAVGQAFEAARETPGAPNLYGPDHHHPSVAGTYLAALVFYRQFTGRTGAGARWRPEGLSVRDAATLVRLNGG